MNAPAVPNETSPANRSALPDSWIGRVFDHMSGLYGSRFADLWRGTDPETVRRMWDEKLAGFREMPGAIKEALDSLDSKPYPPTLPEFLQMCREAAPRHLNKPVMLSYTQTPEDRAKAQEIARTVVEKIVETDNREHKAWAKRLKARDEASERLSLTQVSAYREALDSGDD